MTDKKVVKNSSRAGSGSYSYNYASLADIANQGLPIPEMRVKNVFSPDGTTYIGDWIEFKDSNGEWQLGSRIVETELNRMNAQQVRGAAETYARRYTTLMALALACSDDSEVENNSPKFTQQAPVKPTDKQIELIRKLATEQGMTEAEIEIRLKKITTSAQASQSIKSLQAKS